MKSYLSRFRPDYWRTLVYMLQASEYNLRDYLAWYHRTRDFSQVAKRQKLVMTPKALLLFWFLAVMQVWGWIVGLYGLGQFFIDHQWSGLALVIIGTLAGPFLIAYTVMIPLIVGQLLVQKPQASRLVNRAKAKLASHPGIKIAIAGSFGKTTFKDLLATVLAEGKKVAATPGNMNTPIGISRFAEKLTGVEEVLIFELGEYYPGDIRDLCLLVEPNVGIITGINEAHLSKFKTLDRTVNTIFELGDHLGNEPLYINAESKLARSRVEPDYPLLYSREGVNGWKVTDAQSGLDGTTFTAAKGKKTIQVHTKLLGLHQVGPLAAVISLADSLGLSPSEIEAGIAKTKPFEHRLEPRFSQDGVVTIDDSYNGNPDGFKAAIDFLAALTGHRRFYVTPGMVQTGARTEEVHHEVGRQLATAGIEKVILMRNSATPFIAEGLKEHNFKGELIWFDDALKGLSALPNLTVSGDVVLLQNDWADNYA